MKEFIYYKVLWEGFPPEAATWEPESEIHDDFIGEFEAALLVTEGRPAVLPGLAHKIVPSSIDRSSEERLSRVAVVKDDFSRSSRFLLEESGRALPIPSAFSVVAIEVANVVCGGLVTIPAEVFLHRDGRGTMGFLRHERLIAHHNWRIEPLPSTKKILE